MAEIEVNAGLVAYCGLYCAACKSFLAGRCKGCHENAKATWCKVRTCCMEKGLETCAACTDFPDPRACKKFNNVIAKLFGLVFRSDRAACVTQIKQLGIEGHAKAMAERRSQTIKR